LALLSDLQGKAVSLLLGMLVVVMNRSQTVYKTKTNLIIARITKTKTKSAPFNSSRARFLLSPFNISSDDKEASHGSNSALLFYKSLSIVSSFLGRHCLGSDSIL